MNSKKVRQMVVTAIAGIAAVTLAAGDVGAHAPKETATRPTVAIARATQLSAGEQVDLGLSVNWADRNLGATAENDIGNYYGYGDLSGEETSTSYSKYVSEDISGTDRDPAYVYWGAGWRLPRLSEVNELVNRCEWHWMTLDGVQGYLVVGRNDFSIFLPASGHRSSDKSFFVGKRGYYWSGEVDFANPNYAHTLFFVKGQKICKPFRKIYGCAIRPVHD